MLGPSSFLISSICNALRCRDKATTPISLTWPWICTHGALHATARATLPHSPAKTGSSFPLTCPLGCAEPQRRLGTPSSPYVPLPAKCCAHCHWPRAPWAAMASWAPWLLLVAFGEATQLPCPSAAAQQGTRLTDHMLHRFCPTFSLLLQSLLRKELGKARSLYWILIVLLSG